MARAGRPAPDAGPHERRGRPGGPCTVSVQVDGASADGRWLVRAVDREPGAIRGLDPVEAVAVQLVADHPGDPQQLLARLLDHLVVGSGRAGDEAQPAVLRGLEAQASLVGGVDRAQELPGGSSDHEHLAPPVLIQQMAPPERRALPAWWESDPGELVT